MVSPCDSVTEIATITGMHQPAGHLVHANQLTPGQRNALYRSCKQGQAIKLARGVYINKGLWLELAQEANGSQLQAIARIAAHSHAYPDALAVGRSAALLHGLPLQAFRPPKIVELGATNRSEYPHSRERRWRRISQSHLRGCEMVPTEFGLVRTAGILDTCIDLALWHALEDSVIAAESALNKA